MAKYLFNTELSQDKVLSGMNYVSKQINNNNDYLEWSFDHLTAHGMSSSVPVLSNNQETRNCQLEFRIKTEAQDALLDIRALDGT